MKNGPVQVPEEVKNGPVEVKNGPVQRIFITFYSQKLWRSMSTCWKAWRVYFPMSLVATSLDTPYCLQTRISTDCSEGQQSVVTECWYILPCKTVPIYNVSWCMAYIAGKLLESSFTPKKRFRHLDFLIKSYGQFIGNCSGGQQSREATSGIHFEGTFHIVFPQKLYFVFIPI